MNTPGTALLSPDQVAGTRTTLNPSYPHGEDEPGWFDMSAIRAILWRQRWILVAVTGAVVLAGLVITMLMTPVYTTSTTLRIDPQNAEIIEGQELVDPYIASNEIFRYLETLRAVLQSRSMALQVVDELELWQSRPLLGDLVDEAPPAGRTADEWREELRQSAAGMLMGGVNVDIPINTRIIEIGFSSTDATLAAQVANSYARNFLSDNVSRSLEANAYASEYLETEIAETRQELRDTELAAIEYARANQIIVELPQSTFGEDIGLMPTLTATDLTSTAAQLSEARGQRILAEQRWRTVANVDPGQLPEVRENATIEAMKTRVSQLGSQLSEMRVRYRDDYPPIQGMLAEIATLEQQIAAMGAQVKQSIRNDYQIALRREQALESEVQQISSETLDEQDRRVQYNLLAREAAATREQLAVLLQRYNMISSAANIQRNDATLLDEARVPGAPSSPNLFVNLFLSLVAGVGLAVAIAVLREVFDDRLRSIEDVERRLRVPALGQTPYVAQEIGEELDSVFSPISEAYSSIRATLDFALPKAGNHVIQFTSSEAGEGKTTSAIAVATKFASLGRRVLLIDLDLRRPSVAKSMNIERPKLGVVDVLHARTPLASALVTGEQENLHLLLAGQIPQNPVEILSSGLLPEFLARHRRDYDVIIIDSSPVLGIADAPLLSRFVDAVVFVVEANRANHGQVRQAIRRLRDMNANVIGVMLTKFRALEVGKDYNYQYLYYSYSEK